MDCALELRRYPQERKGLVLFTPFLNGSCKISQPSADNAIWRVRPKEKDRGKYPGLRY